MPLTRPSPSRPPSRPPPLTPSPPSPPFGRYHYGIASAMGYALSMFSETLRDRKLVTLEQDLLILIIGFCFPMVSVVIDGLTYGSAVTISPPEYWALFGFTPFGA